MLGGLEAQGWGCDVVLSSADTDYAFPWGLLSMQSTVSPLVWFPSCMRSVSLIGRSVGCSVGRPSLRLICGGQDDMISSVFRSALKSPSDRGLTSRQFASLWRSLSGGKENFFHETKMFNKFNVAEDGTITLEVSSSQLRVGSQLGLRVGDLSMGLKARFQMLRYGFGKAQCSVPFLK